MWTLVTEYLNDLSKLLLCKPSDLVLQRQGPTPGVSRQQWVSITEENAEWGYLKPDVGFGSQLNAFRVMLTDDILVTQWSLYEFPSCCAFCVSTQVYVAPRFHKLGINTRSNEFRQTLARNAEYTALICTDVLTNIPERKTLSRNGFKDVYQIRNKRTGNNVVISVKEL